MEYEFVEGTMHQFSINVDGPYDGQEQPNFQEPIAKGI